MDDYQYATIHIILDHASKLQMYGSFVDLHNLYCQFQLADV